MGIARDGSPIDLYAEGLPELGEAELVHDAAGAGASILELGCGAGRVTRGLVRLGHGVVAVDESSEMLERLSGLTGVEAVCATIQDLRLDRVFDVVLLASNLINTAENDRRAAMLRTCRRHVADSGCVIIERMDPRWAEPAWAADKVAQPGHIGAVTVTSHGLVVDPPFMTETTEFTLPDGRSWRQGPFTSLILDDDALEIELRSADLCLERWVSWQGTERIWCTARPVGLTHTPAAEVAP